MVRIADVVEKGSEHIHLPENPSISTNAYLTASNQVFNQQNASSKRGVKRISATRAQQQTSTKKKSEKKSAGFS